MSEERIPCCITGCGRTFKKTALDDGCTELMCARHYRCEKALINQRNHIRARRRRINTLARRIQRAQGGNLTFKQLERLDALWEACGRRDNMLWRTIKAIAQERQDAGYWTRPARKPGNKGQNERVEEIPPAEKKLGHRFEDQFERLKQLQRRHPNA